MKHAIRHIDRALKEMYNLDTPHRAEHFLVKQSTEAAKGRQGALLVQENPSNQEISLGIYLRPDISACLSRLSFGKRRDWNLTKLSAFAVASEEVSHFHFLLFHIQENRKVTQFNLELQGEIDKFLLTYFALLPHVDDPGSLFEDLFSQLFLHYRFAETTSPEEYERYESANKRAQEVIKEFREELTQQSFESTLKKLRWRYRLG